MNLKSSFGSICGYSVVDRSVTYARPDLQLSESTVYNRLPNFHISAGSYPFQVTSDWEYCAKSTINILCFFSDDNSMNIYFTVISSLYFVTERKETDYETVTDDLRRRKRSLIYRRQYFRDAMEAFDVRFVISSQHILFYWRILFSWQNAGLLVMSDLDIETRPCVKLDRQYSKWRSSSRGYPRRIPLEGEVSF